MLHTTLTALLLCLGLLSGCSAGDMAGEETAPPAGSAGVTSSGPDGGSAQPLQAPQGSVTMTCRVVDGAESGSLVLAGEGAGGVYTLDTAALKQTAPLSDGMMVDVIYDGTILETYPAQFSNVWSVAPVEGQATDDRCGLYLQALEDLWTVDNGLNADIAELGVDLSGVTDLTEAERSAVAYVFGMTHGVLPLTGTREELIQQGYITAELLTGEDVPDGAAFWQWEKGCLFTIEGKTEDFRAQKWRSSQGAYFFYDCTAALGADGAWTYTIGSEMIS